MNNICPVIFQKDGFSSPGETVTFECKIVPGAWNEIIIKSILPDERFKYVIAAGLIPAPRSENDRFGINILIDGGAVPAHQKITAITIFESWREPSSISKRTPFATLAARWLERMSGTPVAIELADGTVLRGNIEPRLKEERMQIEQLEHIEAQVQKVVLAEKIRRAAPDAALGKKQRRHLQGIAVDGGHATAVNTDEEIISVLRDYKKRRPTDSMMTALDNVITSKPGRTCLHYANANKLLRRLKVIAAPLRPSEFYYKKLR